MAIQDVQNYHKLSRKLDNVCYRTFTITVNSTDVRISSEKSRKEENKNKKISMGYGQKIRTVERSTNEINVKVKHYHQYYQ